MRLQSTNRSSTPSNGLSLFLLLAGASGCSSILEGSPFDAASNTIAVEAEEPEGVSVLVVSAGTFHTCSVTSSGSVACWGDDYHGQSSPPSGSFESVSAGYAHACGVTSSGSVACWGRDEDGESSPP